jgi:hypothetical protein
MDDIEQRIADVLHDNGVHVDDAAELASLLLAELGLTREQATSGCRCESVYYAPHKQGDSGCTGTPNTASRYVTEWVREDVASALNLDDPRHDANVVECE